MFGTGMCVRPSPVCVCVCDVPCGPASLGGERLLPAAPGWTRGPPSSSPTATHKRTGQKFPVRLEFSVPDVCGSCLSCLLHSLLQSPLQSPLQLGLVFGGALLQPLHFGQELGLLLAAGLLQPLQRLPFFAQLSILFIQIILSLFESVVQLLGTTRKRKTT